MMTVLSTYMSAAGTRALPSEAAAEAKHHLLDTVAAMISGSALPPGAAALRYVGGYAGKGAATIAGATLTAAPVDAALANGIMAHADETDDSHNGSRSHPGCAVAPAPPWAHKRRKNCRHRKRCRRRRSSRHARRARR